MSVIDEIAAERKRQVEVKGFTPQHDDQWEDDELAQASICYIENDPSMWPWDEEWWKPGNDERKRLIKAAALLVAHIEHLDRLYTL